MPHSSRYDHTGGIMDKLSAPVGVGVSNRQADTISSERFRHRRTIRTSISRICCVLVFGTVLTGCPARVELAQVMPSYAGPRVASLAIGVTDHRPFILNKDKEEWFEGLMRSAFAIPVSIGRGQMTSGVHATPYRAFAFRVGHMLASGIAQAGGPEPQVVELRPGITEQEGLSQLGATNAALRLFVCMNQSRFDFGSFLHPDYQYDFEAVVADAAGNTLTRRRWSAHETNIHIDGGLTFFDNADLYMYKPVLNQILSDKDVLLALQH